MAGPDPVDPAPGNAGWVRAFAESTAAQREPLADCAHRLPGLRPVYWQGAAAEGFVGALHRLTGEWRTALAVQEQVAGRVDGYNTFVHQLPHLWESYRDDPAELDRLAEVHRATVTELARDLVLRAAELDAVAVATTPADDPRPEPSPLAEPPAPDLEVDPDPHVAEEPAVDPEPEVGPDPVGPEPQDLPAHVDLAAGPPAAFVDPPAALADRLRRTGLLLSQLREGERVHRIPLDHLAAG
ncbi:hypothetical protein ABZ816_08300 [Actinosynnema sp. NPDC047251]|uniref:Uncharacterized protein n=1 Tax=Saccharothrix espanaensis (strain ATCC 51144 / DSM 44229 / JCM 9112 / NBRC 15066 / NRRL 15764) TaxID=1179773 RepID=K3W492_SACES|nr:hypothetical protein [Saccharothrix espanaensis]CCH27542.1 hypothetical protein BN6_02090 [Saccharothrix espanaensis DSM 44229]